jgi:hypothetical protein
MPVQRFSPFAFSETQLTCPLRPKRSARDSVPKNCGNDKELFRNFLFCQKRLPY